jgi:hypothetical protein
VRALIGFGHPLVTLLWGLSFAGIVWWMVWLLLRRRLVTFLSSQIFFLFFLPVVLQYPFTFSPLNGLTIGPENFETYQSQIDSALLITLAGMGALLVGYGWCGHRSGRLPPLTLVTSGLRIWLQSVFLQISSGFILLLFVLLASVGLLGAEGARNIAQSQPALRPIYNIAHVLLPLTIALCLFVGFRAHRRTMLALGIMNTALAALTGARTVALGGLLLYVMALLIHRSLLGRLSVGGVLKLIPIAGGLLLAAVYLGDVREGQYNLLRTVATLGLKLFYGNNFSDLRDFAWVKSFWNGDYYLGWTQAAGLLAFIPSAVSPFRAEWNWGVITTTLVGQDPLINPGLRTGLFGETFFNFGLPGVFVAGFLYGYFIRRVHNVCLVAARTAAPYEAQLKILAGLITINLAGSLLNTAGFYSFYITVAVLSGLQVLEFMIRSMRHGQMGSPAPDAASTAPSA